MNIYVKLKGRATSFSEKYKKMLAVDQSVYPDIDRTITSSVQYTPGAIDDECWFYVENASNQTYAIDLLKEEFSSADLDLLKQNQFCKIDYLFEVSGENILFQRITSSKLISKKCILNLGDNFHYEDNNRSIQINDYPDAIYKRSEDRLYFQRLEKITKIFKGIDQLYREATNSEVEEFLESDFIKIDSGFSSSKVGTPNRKRIALVKDRLSAMTEKQKKAMLDYIGNYKPSLQRDGNAFKIKNDEELKELIYGIDERYYTTIIGSEKRLANSVINL